MPRFAANLSMLYPESGFLERFSSAARDGFKGVEYLFPYAFDPRDIALRLRDHGLQQVLFNAPPGDWDRGERGLACVEGREDEFRDGIATALNYADALACPRIHVMAGLAPSDTARDALYATYVSRLRWAAREAAGLGIDILVEPINTRDIPGYYLNRQDVAHGVLDDVGEPNLKVQMDLYHCAIVEGDLAMKIRRYIGSGRVGHVQIAGVPDRHEPDTGEVNFSYLFDVLDESGYTGWVGCEYRPKAGSRPGGTSDGLGWLAPYLTRID